MAVQTFSYSAFLRGPTQVLPSLDDADVILERRDEENLVLMRAERFEATAAGLGIAARSLSVLARRHRDLAEELLAEELPWLHWLPETERTQCVRELLADLVAGADTGLLLPFARNLASWRATAEVWSDPELARDLQGPFPGDGPDLARP
jgi:PHD/YefM family antitoxin component YafN of YafNO toxin-antitoxin module